MAFEPRLRGPRFGKPSTKRASAKAKKEKPPETFDWERKEINPAEIASRVLNSLEHLGNQRFPLPPFAEHFERWLKDIKTLIWEFETQLPQPADGQFDEVVGKIVSNVEEEFKRRMLAEKENATQVSNLQRQLTAIDIEISKLDEEYSRRTRQIKSLHETSAGTLKQQIFRLDKERQKLLRSKTSLLERIFRRSSKFEQSTAELQSKRHALGHVKDSLKTELEKFKAEHDSRKKQLLDSQRELRTKTAELTRDTLDDALASRKTACQELGQAVNEAIQRLPVQNTPHGM